GKVASNLDIADKRRAAGDLPRVSPSDAIVSGIANEQRTAAHIEVVPGNVHPTIKRRSLIGIGPARFPVIVVAVVDAIMRPAIRAPGGGGFVSAEPLTAAASVQPDSEPGPGRTVVQNNRIPHGVGERALSAAGGETHKGVAAVGGN